MHTLTRSIGPFLLLLLLLPALARADQRRPNVVVILADDQGWGDLSLNGNPNLETPNVDSLARDGAAFDRFFVCPASRALTRPTRFNRPTRTGWRR